MIKRHFPWLDIGSQFKLDRNELEIATLLAN